MSDNSEKKQDNIELSKIIVNQKFREIMDEYVKQGFHWLAVVYHEDYEEYGHMGGDMCPVCHASNMGAMVLMGAIQHRNCPVADIEQKSNVTKFRNN